jgi:hypothetical protein
MWRKSEEVWRKSEEMWRKSEEMWRKSEELWRKSEEMSRKSEKKGKKSTKKIIVFEVGNIVFGTLSVEYMVEKVWKKWRKPNICVRLCPHVIDFVY